MFTGIIQRIGRVVKISHKNNALQLAVKIESAEKSVKIGDSVAVNGVCLTVTAKSIRHKVKSTGNNKNDPSSILLTFDVMPETIQRTTIKTLKIDDKVNIELAIMSGEPFGGHFVQGHIDTTGKVSSVNKRGENYLLQIKCPIEATKSIVEKGSVAIDGISLTVVNVQPGRFSVALIPYTLNHTTLGKKKTGDEVNIESDMLGKYLRKLLPSKPLLGFPSDEGF